MTHEMRAGSIIERSWNDLRYETGKNGKTEIVNYGRLTIPGDTGEIRMIQTAHGEELRWTVN